MVARWLILLMAACCQIVAAASHDDLPSSSSVLPDYDRAAVEKRLSELPMSTIEGIWQFADNGALVVIERYDSESGRSDGMLRYRMVVLYSPRLSVRPGTVMGYISMSAKEDMFDARVYTSFDGGAKLSGLKDFRLKLASDSRLSFIKDRSGVKLNLWRFLPYMYRYSVSIKDDRPRDMDGCIKVFPQPVDAPVAPRYL